MAEDDASYLELSSVYSDGSYVAELRPFAKLSTDQRASLKKLTVTVDGPIGGVTIDRVVSWSTASPLPYVSGSARSASR